MNQLKNILIIFVSLLLFNNGTSERVLKSSSEKTSFTTYSHTHNFVLSNFVEDSFPNEDFDLEEDFDDTDDDFIHISTSKNILVLDEHTNTHLYHYSYSIQSVKRFILYCSLKLHC
jgi:hypothetical protein